MNTRDRARDRYKRSDIFPGVGEGERRAKMGKSLLARQDSTMTKKSRGMLFRKERYCASELSMRLPPGSQPPER